MTLHLGKNPPVYDSRDILLTDVRASLPFPVSNLPTTWGHGSDFASDVAPPGGWGMMGNGPQDDHSIDSTLAAAGGCGDCAWAGPAHEVMQAAHEAQRPIPLFTCKTIVDQYSAYSGYNEKTGENDNGSYVREVLKWRQQTGLRDNAGTMHKVGIYVSIEPGNWQAMREACYLFESVGIGIEFPDSAMNQFSNRQLWSVVPGAQIIGGHYVPVVGHPMGGLWTCITWGRRQVMTWDFLAKYCDEAYCYLDAERYSAVTGETAEHWTNYDLEKYITMFGTKP